MAEITGFKQLLMKLKQKAAQYLEHPNSVKGESVSVGYTAGYSLYVHENMKMRHKKGKQAKFLEQPARELADELGENVVASVRGGMKLQQALFVAGLRLQRESQKIVPVKTGNLRASAFTRKE